MADRYGRRKALMASVLLMCFGSLLIAVTPTYAAVGVAAPVLLGLARIVQGLSLGASTARAQRTSVRSPTTGIEGSIRASST